MGNTNPYIPLSLKLFKSPVVALRSIDPEKTFEYLQYLYQIYEAEKRKRGVKTPLELLVVSQGLPDNNREKFILFRINHNGLRKEDESAEAFSIANQIVRIFQTNPQTDFSLFFFDYPYKKDEETAILKLVDKFLHEWFFKGVEGSDSLNIKNIVVVSDNPQIPKIAEKITTRINFPVPTEIERRALITEYLSSQLVFYNKMKLSGWENLEELAVVNPEEALKSIDKLQKEISPKVEGGKEVLDKIVKLTSGLTLSQIVNVLVQNGIWEDGKIKIDVRKVIQSKEILLGNNPALELYHPVDDLPELVGFERAILLTRKLFDEGNPRGILLVGVPGMGKSLFAKTVAKQFDLPTVFFKISRVFGMYLGETEERMEDALKTIDSLGESIVVIDEIDKVIAGENKHEVTERVFGMFHTWLQERKSKSLIIATANDISKLPKSLFRAGRWNATFFVGYYPSEKHYEKLIEIYKERYRLDKKLLDLTPKYFKENRFSGAEIDATLEMAKILNEPVSKVLKEGWVKPLSEAEPEELEKYLKFEKKYPLVHSEKPDSRILSFKSKNEERKRKTFGFFKL